jgi:hypothetical protein
VRKFVLPAIVAAAVGFAFLPSAARADGVPYLGTGSYYVAPSYPYVAPSYAYVPPTYYTVPSFYSFSYSVPLYSYYPRYYGPRIYHRDHFRHGREWHGHHHR